jgi:hypothetical protein
MTTRRMRRCRGPQRCRLPDGGGDARDPQRRSRAAAYGTCVLYTWRDLITWAESRLGPADTLDLRGGCRLMDGRIGRGPPEKRERRPADTATAHLETSDRNNSYVTVYTTVPADRQGVLTRVGNYVLLDYERCDPPATGRVAIATVLLPSGKLGRFAIYNLWQQFAEWWPTASLGRVRRRDHRELNAALPFAVALVRQFDSDALIKRDFLPARLRSDGARK